MFKYLSSTRLKVFVLINVIIYLIIRMVVKSRKVYCYGKHLLTLTSHLNLENGNITITKVGWLILENSKGESIFLMQLIQKAFLPEYNL